MTTYNQKFYCYNGNRGDWSDAGSGYFNSVSRLAIASCDKVGVSNPNFQVKIDKGLDASSNYTRSGVEFIRSPFVSANCGWYSNHFRRQAEVDTLQYFGISPFPLGQFPGHADNDNLALKRLKNKLSGDSKQFQALVPIGELGELHQLVGGFVKPVLQLVSTLHDLKHGKRASTLVGGKNYHPIKSARDVSKFASEAWLTYSFGVRPMVNDVNNLRDAIAQHLKKEQGTTVRERGGAQTVWNTQNALLTGQTSLMGFSGGTIQSSFTHTLTTNIVSAYRLYPVGSNNYSALQHYGLEVSQLPSVGWELLPYSWLADYFSNVGDVLQDTFQSPAGSSVYCTNASRYSVEGFFQWNQIPTRNKTISTNYESGTTNFGYAAVTNGSSRAWSYQRTALSELPHQTLRVKSMSEIGSNPIPKILNLVSLLLK